MNISGNMQDYISNSISKIDDALSKWDEVVFENPTNIGKKELIKHLVHKHGQTLLISQSYNVNKQWNDCDDMLQNTVFATYAQFASIDNIYEFCAPYNLIIFDEAHHTGANTYIHNVDIIINKSDRRAKIFGTTTHTKRYSDSAEDIAQTIFNNHKIDGISFELAIQKHYLPQFDYISALYSLPKDVDNLVATSSLAKRIISDSGLVQVNEDGIKRIIQKHMPTDNRKVIYFVPSIEDSIDAEKLSVELNYGKTYVINYSKSEKENEQALKEYNDATKASLVCISKFYEGIMPEGTNTVVILKRTTTINVFEKQILMALWSAKEKPVIFDFVANIDNLVYSYKKQDKDNPKYYNERIKSICNQSIVIDYARQWSSVFEKIRKISKSHWTNIQDEQLRKYYPKYGNDVYKYITGHSLNECILRAELLGIEYIPPKAEPESKEITKVPPISFDIDIVKYIDNKLRSKVPQDEITKLCENYLFTLQTGYTQDNFAKVIRSIQKKTNIQELLSILIEHTRIDDTQDVYEIKRHQSLFKNRVGKTIDNKHAKAVTAVVVGGKILKGEVTTQEIHKIKREQKLEKQKENMVLVGDHYINKKNSIAGLFGESEIEHILYKTYWRLIIGNYHPENNTQLVQHYSEDEVIQKINNLRNTNHPWTADEETMMQSTAKGKKKDAYRMLLRVHSDKDILLKAKELDNCSLLSCAIEFTSIFEKNFKTFLTDYHTLANERQEKEEKRKLQQQKEKEAHERKQASKKRLQNLEKTVAVVSKNKIVTISKHK